MHGSSFSQGRNMGIPCKLGAIFIKKTRLSLTCHDLML